MMTDINLAIKKSVKLPCSNLPEQLLGYWTKGEKPIDIIYATFKELL
jgi:hypothetical protein